VPKHRVSHATKFEDYYIYIIYTPNLGFEIAVRDREREQSRFRGSSEGSRGRSKGAVREHGGASREHRRAQGVAQQVEA